MLAVLEVVQAIPVPVDGIRGLLDKDLGAALLEEVRHTPVAEVAAQVVQAELAKAATLEKADKVDK